MRKFKVKKIGKRIEKTVKKGKINALVNVTDITDDFTVEIEKEMEITKNALRFQRIIKATYAVMELDRENKGHAEAIKVHLQAIKENTERIAKIKKKGLPEPIFPVPICYNIDRETGKVLKFGTIEPVLPKLISPPNKEEIERLSGDTEGKEKNEK